MSKIKRKNFLYTQSNVLFEDEICQYCLNSFEMKQLYNSDRHFRTKENRFIFIFFISKRGGVPRSLSPQFGNKNSI